jgi:hypothetical protein
MASERVMCPGCRRAGWALGVVLGGSWVLACAPGSSGSGGAVQRRDSSGVEIVESVRPAWEEGEGWAVGPQPLVRIGVVEGESAAQFTGVTGAVRLGDGTIVVADDGSQEVRFFAPDGAHLKTVGRRGGGPREFTGLAGLGKDAGDRVWAYDFSLRRITWMDGEGEVTGLTSFGLEPAMLAPVGVLRDDTFLLKQLWGAEETSEASTTGLRRDPIAFVRFDLDGNLVDTLGLFPGREVYLTEEDGRGVMNTPPFARNTSTTIRRGRVVVGPQSRFELLELSPEGRLVRVVRLPWRENAVGAAELEAYIQGRLRMAPPERHPEIRRSLETMPIPETMPPYGAIQADDAGNLWVGAWAMYPETAAIWDVFDATGAWLGTVPVPSGFGPWDIGDDWILGVEQDELDVEYVVVYPLIKAGAAST